MRADKPTNSLLAAAEASAQQGDEDCKGAAIFCPERKRETLLVYFSFNCIGVLHAIKLYIHPSGNLMRPVSQFVITAVSGVCSINVDPQVGPRFEVRPLCDGP